MPMAEPPYFLGFSRMPSLAATSSLLTASAADQWFSLTSTLTQAPQPSTTVPYWRCLVLAASHLRVVYTLMAQQALISRRRLRVQPSPRLMMTVPPPALSRLAIGCLLLQPVAPTLASSRMQALVVR